MLSRRGHRHCLRRLSGEGSQPFENEAAGSDERQQGDSISRSSRTHISGTHTRSDPVHVPAGQSSPLLASASCISRTAVRCLPAASGGSADQAEWLALADVRDHAHPASTTAPPTPASPATRWTIFACAVGPDGEQLVRFGKRIAQAFIVVPIHQPIISLRPRSVIRTRPTRSAPAVASPLRRSFATISAGML